MLSEVGRGVKRADAGLDYERAVLAAGPIGSCRPAWSGAALRARAQAVGEPIGTFQLVQGKIADMYTTMNASRAYVYAVAKPATAARPPGGLGGRHSLRRGKATQCALDAIQLLGGNGYINDYPTGRCCATQNSMNRRRHQRNPPHADRPGAV